MTADDLAAVLDERDEPWDLYRVWERSWCCKLGPPGHHDARTFTSPSILKALQSAVDAGPPLPVIPRRPMAVRRHLFEVRKDGSKWSLYYAGHRQIGNQSTRKACEEIADRLCSIHETEAAEWEAEHGPKVAGKVEGVDFRWRQW